MDFNFNFDFELILFYASVITGVLSGLDVFYFAKRRARRGESVMPWYMDYARSFFPILIIVFFARSFLYEPFRIPTGSLEPSLLTGDFILVDKHRYGLRMPITGKILGFKREPERGDIMLFRWPANPSYYFIKRVIGLPGDEIEYRDKFLYVNGKKIEQKIIDSNVEDEDAGTRVEERAEFLPERTHRIYVHPDRENHNFVRFTVPKNMYFMMGDNRDASADSRFFGFVPDENIVGKAMWVWMSWDSKHSRVRFNRILKTINQDSDHA